MPTSTTIFKSLE